MKSSKITSEQMKTYKTSVVNQRCKTKKSQSTEVLGRINLTKDAKSKSLKKTEGNNVLSDRELAELALNDELGATFEKFWKSLTDGVDKHMPHTFSVTSPVDKKISEVRKRIKLNQHVLKNANERIKGITFANERQNLAQWKEGLSFRNPSREDLNRFKDVKALNLEIQKLKESKPDRKMFLKSSPGIVNFHETMESTLSMLEKIQKGDDLEDYDLGYSDVKCDLNLNFIKAPNLVPVSDEE